MICSALFGSVPAGLFAVRADPAANKNRGLTLVPRERIELSTSPLPRVRSTHLKALIWLAFTGRRVAGLPPNSQSPVRLNATPPSYCAAWWKRDCA